VLVAFGQVACAGQVARRAFDGEFDVGESISQSPFDQAHGQVRDVDADPAAIQLLRGVDRCAAAAEGIENDIALVAAGGNDAFEQSKRLLGWVPQALRAYGVDSVDVVPDVADGLALEFIDVALVLRHRPFGRPVNASFSVEFIEAADRVLPVHSFQPWINALPRLA
jgi:hypothetical protein